MSGTHSRVIEAISKACLFYQRDTVFGYPSFFYHGELGKQRANKIVICCERALGISHETNVHWIIALASLECQGKSMVQRISQFLSWSGVFPLDAMHAMLKQHEMENYVTAVTAAVRALVEQKLDISQIEIADQLCQSFNEGSVDDQPDILSLLVKNNGMPQEKILYKIN